MRIALVTLLSALGAAAELVSARSASQCVIEPNAIVSDTHASYSALDSLNSQIAGIVRDITQNTDFFAYYRLNLFSKTCPYWSDSSSMCGNIACAVNTLDNEEDIPEIWRTSELGKLHGPKAEHPGPQVRERREKSRPLQGELGDDVGESCVVEYDDECDERDYCVPEDESASGKGDYVSLVDNPEKFTGYSGPGARQVWNAIYRENCFAPKTVKEPPKENPAQMRQSNQGRAALQFRSVFEERQLQEQLASGDDIDEDLDIEGECVEKRVFYRVISGMHASISTHLCGDYLNKSTGQWGPNLQCHQDRLEKHPERVSNLYFNFALLLRAVGKLGIDLENYTFCSGDSIQDSETKNKVLSLASKASSRNVFDERSMFQDPSVAGLKEDFRNRFRNVSRLMDCVGCDKCRLWGKVQTAGYGAALKVLFEFDEQAAAHQNPHLRRTELVALVNTLGRVSHSLSTLQKLRIMSEAVKKGQPLNESEQAILMDTEEEFEPDEPSLAEEFQTELDRVVKAFMWVFRSWIELPSTLLQICVGECSRLWYSFIGLPPPPRTWKIRMPHPDDL